jgi:ferric-dicitrate binding protein FerR (iron transport regulator)
MFGLKLGLPRWPARKASEAETPSTPAPSLSPIASAVVLAAGAGVAFWWWTQWARGRAETEADLTGAGADVPKDPE